jgi:hypothetical protein
MAVGRPKNPPSSKKMLKEVLPLSEIFDEAELKMYNDLVDVYLADFDAEDLTSSDMDDILDLAKNRVLEFRLLKGSKDNTDRQLDIAASVEKLSKKNEKIKESLSTRRKDRINPNEFKGFSIVDLAIAYDYDKKVKLKNRVDRLKQEEKELLEKKRRDYVGNRRDADVREHDNEDDD